MKGDGIGNSPRQCKLYRHPFFENSYQEAEYRECNNERRVDEFMSSVDVVDVEEAEALIGNDRFI